MIKYTNVLFYTLLSKELNILSCEKKFNKREDISNTEGTRLLYLSHIPETKLRTPEQKPTKSSSLLKLPCTDSHLASDSASLSFLIL